MLNMLRLLRFADVGVAMGVGGSALAVEAADMALFTNDLGTLAFAMQLGRRVSFVILVNMAFALIVKVIVLGLAFQGRVTLWASVFADVGSALLVTLHGLSVLWYQNQLKPRGAAGREGEEGGSGSSAAAATAGARRGGKRAHTHVESGSSNSSNRESELLMTALDSFAAGGKDEAYEGNGHNHQEGNEREALLLSAALGADDRHSGHMHGSSNDHVTVVMPHSHEHDGKSCCGHDHGPHNGHAHGHAHKHHTKPGAAGMCTFVSCDLSKAP